MARNNAIARKTQSRVAHEPGSPARPARVGRRHAVEFDRLIHEQSRLGIISALAVNPSLSFSDLKTILKTTDGNLSVHARKLETADYIACRKFFQGRVPKTEYRLTPLGRRALERYLDQMEALIQASRVHAL